MNELESFGAGLEQKPMMLAASKIDAANPEKQAKLQKFAKRKKLLLYPISAVTGEGVKELVWAMAHMVRDLREGRAPEVVLEEATPEGVTLAAKKKKKKTVKKSAKKKTTSRAS
jgi:GTPase